MMKRLCCVAILIVWQCASPAEIAADEFHDAYKRGRAAWATGDYAAARAEFLRAYELRNEPVIVFNIAQTYRKESDVDRALEYYNRFLDEPNTEARLREQARTWVHRLQHDKQTRLGSSRALMEPDARVALAAPRSDVPRVETSFSSPAALNDTQPGTAASDTLWSTKRKSALAIAGGATLALIGGAVLGLAANAKRDEARMLCPDLSAPCTRAAQANALLESSHRPGLAADVAFGVGAAALVAAGVLWFTGAPEGRRSARLAIVPCLSPDSAGVAAQGHF